MSHRLIGRVFTNVASFCLLLTTIFVPSGIHPTATTQSQDHLNLIGQIGGATNAVHVQGDIAYFGIGPRFVIADISDSTNPIVLGASAALPKVIEDIAVSGNYAYVADMTGQIKILATTPPANPRLIGHLDTPGAASGLAVQGALLFIADGFDGGLQIANIANPVHPMIIGSHDTPGSANSLVVSDSLLYLGDGFGGVAVFDTVDPHSPRLIGVCCGTSGPYLDLALSGDRLYGVNGTTLTVIDVSDPTTPVARGYIFTPGEDRTVAARGHYAYVGTRAEFSSSEGGLRAIDCSNPDNPIEVGYLDTPGEPADLAGSGSNLYLADGSGGLRLVSISAPTTPVETSVLDQSWLGILVSANQDIAYVAGPNDLLAVTAADPTNPTVLGSLSLPYRTEGLTNSGSMVYATAGGDLHLIDAHDPTSPTQVGLWSPPELWIAVNLVVQNNLAFVVDLSSSLFIVDVSDPTTPQEIGYLHVGVSGPIAINDAGNRVFVSDDTNIITIDVTNPAQPSLEATHSTSGFIRSMTCRENRLYTVDSTNGLTIYDTSNPAQLVLLGQLSINNPFDVQLTGSTAYVSVGRDGLLVVDVADPAAPNVLDQLMTPGAALATAIGRHGIYTAAYTGGMAVITNLPPRVFLPMIVQRN